MPNSLNTLELIDKNKEVYDLKSYTTWGFMGVEPSELNIAIV